MYTTSQSAGGKYKSLLLTGFLIIGVLLLSVIFGFASAVFPWWWIVALILAFTFFIIGVGYPTLATLALVAISSKLIADSFLPSIPFLGGTLPFSDVGLIAVSGFALIKYYSDRSKVLLAAKPVVVPIIVIFLIFLFSILRALIELRLPIKDVLGESRHFLYWLLVPVVILVTANRSRMHFFIYGLLIIAALFSVGQILQGVFGINVFGRELTELDTMGNVSSNVLRSMTSGIHLIVWGFMFVTMLFIFKVKSNVLLILLCGLLGAGIFLTYGRAIWGGVVIALFLLSFKVGLKRFSRVGIMYGIVGILGISAMLAIKPAAISGAVDRLFSVESEVEKGSSLAWRYYENELSWAAIKSHPILGIGLGAAYRPHMRSDVTAEQVRYVHSAYMYVTLKMGTLAMAAIIWLLVTVFALAIRLSRSKDVLIAVFSLATIGALIEYVLACITQPELMQTPGITLLAVMVALLCSANYINEHEPLA